VKSHLFCVSAHISMELSISKGNVEYHYQLMYFGSCVSQNLPYYDTVH